MQQGKYVYLFLFVLLIGCTDQSVPRKAMEAKQSEGFALVAKNTAPLQKSKEELVEQYGDLKLTDTHNHDASGYRYKRMIGQWKVNEIDRVVLFGNVSEPSAITTDEIAWKAYLEYPDMVIPYFSGFNLHDKSSLEVVRNNLEKGYFGLGEVVAASKYSKATSNVAWKGMHPMDGYLPEIYELCAAYNAPILLHIDPPSGMAMDKLEIALDAYPDTTFILAHMNVFMSPETMQGLMKRHENLYGGFFAGHTVFQSSYQLKDYVPVIKQFPNRFFLGSDSGYGLSSEAAAIEAMYRLIDVIDNSEIVRKVAYENYDAIIQAQPATTTQLQAIKNMGVGKKYNLAKLSKFEAGQILYSRK